MCSIALLSVVCVCSHGSGTNTPRPSRSPRYSKGPFCPCPARCQGQGHVRIRAWECRAACHARKTGPAASPHAATGMREGTAPEKGLLAFCKVVWGGAEPQMCSRAVVCSCPCHSLLLSCGWDTTHDLSSCDDRISRVFPLQDVAVSGGDSAYAFVAMCR